MKHRHNAFCGDNFCFHGAFKEKAKAVTKEGSTPGSFIKPLIYPPYSISDRRYAVLTRRNPAVPSHMKLGRHDLRRFNLAREWMQENRWNYHNAQALAQDASHKYDVAVKDLLPAARELFRQQATGNRQQENPLFSRAEKRLLRMKAKRGIKSLLGFGERKQKSKTTQRPATPQHRSASRPESGVRNEVIEAVADQFKISQRKAAQWVPAAQGGDTFQSLFSRAMAKVKRNPDLSHKEREAFERATEFFRGFHGSEPTKVIEMEDTIIESGDYSMVGRFMGFDMTAMPIKPFREMEPNFRVKNSILDAREPQIMLVGGKIERVPIDELEYDAPGWVVPDAEGMVPVAHHLMIMGGNQNLEPKLESIFGVTSKAQLLDLGEITNVWYVAKKKPDGYRLTAYHHHFGEEEATPAQKRAARPYLMYDRDHQKLFIVGGEYSVPVEGIRN